MYGTYLLKLVRGSGKGFLKYSYVCMYVYTLIIFVKIVHFHGITFCSMMMFRIGFQSAVLRGYPEISFVLTFVAFWEEIDRLGDQNL